MENEYYRVSKDKLLYLLRRDAELKALEWAGVDNWNGAYMGYMNYLQEFFGEDYDGLHDFQDVAQKQLKEYAKV